MIIAYKDRDCKYPLTADNPLIVNALLSGVNTKFFYLLADDTNYYDLLISPQKFYNNLVKTYYSLNTISYNSIFKSNIQLIVPLKINVLFKIDESVPIGTVIENEVHKINYNRKD